MFKTRSNRKELLDGDSIDEKDLIRNLKELHTINKYLGGYSVSINGLKKVLQQNKTFRIVDIGCGGGDTLKALHTWCRKNYISTQLTGVDIKPECIAYCSSNNFATPGISFICDDYRNILQNTGNVDVLHAALFCHHLSHDELLELINFAHLHKIILVINDLERNPIAYYAIKILTALFSKSYLVKNDAPLSVLRGFKKKEWESMLDQSNASNYTVLSKWAFRHEIIVHYD